MIDPLCALPNGISSSASHAARQEIAWYGPIAPTKRADAVVVDAPADALTNCADLCPFGDNSCPRVTDRES